MRVSLQSSLAVWARKVFMAGVRLYLSAFFLLFGMEAHAQLNCGELRGELLYTTHCNACHSYEVHWRKQKLATDWSSLVTQVRRWQASVGLNWSDEEISDVASYLNRVHYGFPVRASKGYSQGNKIDDFLHQ